MEQAGTTMETKVFRTNLKCQSCVSAAASFLDEDQDVALWSVDTADDRKPLSITGTRIDTDHIRSIVRKAGFDVFEELPDQLAILDKRRPAQPVEVRGERFLPLILVFSYLIGMVILLQLKAGRFDPRAAMNGFMGGFFLIFSFFKMLDLEGFASAFQSYDLLAKRTRAYAYIYPFIELLLGVCYIAAIAPLVTNIANFSVMSLGTLGVATSLLNKTKIRCACLGTVFNLPMTKVTLIEDLLMVVMSAAMLASMA